MTMLLRVLALLGLMLASANSISRHLPSHSAFLSTCCPWLVCRPKIAREVFGSRSLAKGPAYHCETLPNFSTKNHVVMDVGGHVGVFGLYALMNGAHKVIAYEPHPENAGLYRSNTRDLPVELHELALVGQLPPQLLKVEDLKEEDLNEEDLKEDPPLKEEDLKRAAVAVAGVAGEAVAGVGGHLKEKLPLQEEDDKRLAHTPGGTLATAALALGRDYQGVKNTWRHSLAPYTHYKGPVESVQVATMEFSRALTDEITFVKMDCEGAELDILPTVTSWRNVSHLVFEYSFTKRRDMAFFWDVISQLRGLGFDSIAFKDYTGEVDEAQWRSTHGHEWLGSTDALVFCLRSTSVRP